MSYNSSNNAGLSGIIMILFMAFIMVISFISCSDDDTEGAVKPPSNLLNKIMPLGASRVEGGRPEFESFRFELWKLLVESGADFDFVGTMADDASYPQFQDTPFDTDHEGRGGWTSELISQNIESWLDLAGTPDIVLFSSPAGNDALTNMPFDQAIANINTIINSIQAENPNVTIIIELLAPGRSDLMTPTLTNYFNQLQAEVINIASQQSTTESMVIAVDMSTGFNDSLLADDVHYNEEGAKFIADRYYEVLKDILRQ